MKYLLVFVRDQETMYEGGNEEQFKAAMEAWNDFNREAIDAGALIANEALELPRTAKTVRFGDDDLTVTDGPFAETKEQLGGFCLLDCENLDEAIEWAKKVPTGPGGVIEVRAVKDLSPYGYVNVTPDPDRQH